MTNTLYSYSKHQLTLYSEGLPSRVYMMRPLAAVPTTAMGYITSMQ